MLVETSIVFKEPLHLLEIIEWVTTFHIKVGVDKTFLKKNKEISFCRFFVIYKRIRRE
jgi:hypothetical protein